MGYPQKLVTCCYCGARTVLVLDKSRHELACANCGAPLHDLKMLPKKAKGKAERVKPSAVRQVSKPVKKSKKKKLKSWLSEAFDLLEDIID